MNTCRFISQNRYINGILRWIAKWDDKFHHHHTSCSILTLNPYYLPFFQVFFANDSLTIYCKCEKKLSIFPLYTVIALMETATSEKKNKLGKALISARFNDKGFYFIIYSFVFIATFHTKFTAKRIIKMCQQ